MSKRLKVLSIKLSQQSTNVINLSMIDHVTLYIDDCTLFYCLLENNRWKYLDFDPIYSKGEIVSFKADYLNLYIRVLPHKIFIKNSLHVFFKKDNSGDFNYKELCSSGNIIAELFNKTIKDLKVGSFEFGLNIKGRDDTKMWNNANAYKKKEISNMRYHGRVYGKKIHLTEYFFKIYDKTLEQKLHHGRINNEFVTRFEIGFCKKRSVKFIETLADLFNKDNLRRIFQKLLNTLNTIEFFPELECLSKMSYKERELIYIYSNNKYWEIEGKLRYEATKKRRAKFIKEQKQLYSIEKIVEELTIKFEELIS